MCDGFQWIATNWVLHMIYDPCLDCVCVYKLFVQMHTIILKFVLQIQ